MKEDKKERDQWIPWEVSYSLKETSRQDKNGNAVTSHTNAMIAVILPDRSNKYDYYLENMYCCSNHCCMHHTKKLFKIIRNNKFNYKNAVTRKCTQGDTIYHGECSYIKAVKWSDFISNYQSQITDACNRQDNVDNYELYKDIE